MRKVLAITFGAVVAALALPVPEVSAQSRDWVVNFGVSGVYRPTYMGSDETKLVPKPLLDIKWRNTIEVEDYDIKFNVFSGRHHKIGLILSYDEGRVDNSSSNSRTKNVHNVDPTAMAGMFASYFFGTWKFDFRMQQDVVGASHTNGGYIAQTSVMYGARVAPEATFMIGPRVTYGSDEYMQSYFGVNTVDARRSGLARYNAGAGIRDYAIVGQFNYDITARWVAVMSLEYSALQGDAKGSPMAVEDVYGAVGLGLKYKF